MSMRYDIKEGEATSRIYTLVNQNFYLSINFQTAKITFLL